jgi:hypothetical protein
LRTLGHGVRELLHAPVSIEPAIFVWHV